MVVILTGIILQSIELYQHGGTQRYNTFQQIDDVKTESLREPRHHSIWNTPACGLTRNNITRRIKWIEQQLVQPEEAWV